RALVSAIASDLRQQLAADVRDVVAISLAEAFEQLGAQPAAPGRLIRGIDPHALYSAKFLADRWEYSVSHVRDNIPREELPRVKWRGGSIRYRGIDILRYEGVPDEEL